MVYTTRHFPMPIGPHQLCTVDRVFAGIRLDSLRFVSTRSGVLGRDGARFPLFIEALTSQLSSKHYLSKSGFDRRPGTSPTPRFSSFWQHSNLPAESRTQAKFWLLESRHERLNRGNSPYFQPIMGSWLVCFCRLLAMHVPTNF